METEKMGQSETEYAKSLAAHTKTLKTMIGAVAALVITCASFWAKHQVEQYKIMKAIEQEVTHEMLRDALDVFAMQNQLQPIDRETLEKIKARNAIR